jgi:hypothetical protein
MAPDTTRLERLIEDEAGDCCDADLEARLNELDSLAVAGPAGHVRDLAALKALGDDVVHRLLDEFPALREVLLGD